MPPHGFFTVSSRALATGLAKAGVRRLVVVGLASVLTGASGASLMDEPGYPNEYRSFYLGHAAGLDELRTCDLDWAYIAPAGDFDHDGKRVGRYRIAEHGDPADRITYADFAIALLDEIEDPPPPPRHRQHPGGVMPEVHDSPNAWVADHIRRFEETDGRPRPGSNDLLLTTRGWRSGELRRTALVYQREDDRYVLAASNHGADHHPAWYLNLLADPHVTVQVGTETFSARARPATAAERPHLWRLMVSAMPEYATYQRRTTREIPIVLLNRVYEREVPITF